MNSITAGGAHNRMCKVAVTATLLGMAALGMAVPAGATPGFVGAPGIPIQDPTNPSTVDCTATPNDPACTGGANTVLTPEFAPPAVPVWPTEAPAN